MTSGPTMFMVLSREDAIDGMRDMMGPADPEEAKKVAPERSGYILSSKKVALKGLLDSYSLCGRIYVRLNLRLADFQRDMLGFI